MKRMEKIFIVSVIIAAIGVLAFVYFGVTNQMEIAKWTFVLAGCAALVGDIAATIQHIRKLRGTDWMYN